VLDAVASVMDVGGPLLGYSQGARLALALAIERPDLVSDLVLVSGSPGIEDSSERTARAQSDRSLARRIEELGTAAFLEEWTSSGITSTTSLPHGIRAADMAMRSTDAAGLAAAVRGYGQGAQPSYWNRLPEVTIPVLLIAGERDAKYVHLARQLDAAIADSTLAIIPDAGHNPLLDQPASTAKALEEFLP
jgi:2-succinyl-6-hydroxy-2,4-cyclohexadiene-1-carboxylate synthase